MKYNPEANGEWQVLYNQGIDEVSSPHIRASVLDRLHWGGEFPHHEIISAWSVTKSLLESTGLCGGHLFPLSEWEESGHPPAWDSQSHWSRYTQPSMSLSECLPENSSCSWWRHWRNPGNPPLVPSQPSQRWEETSVGEPDFLAISSLEKPCFCPRSGRRN